MNKTAIEWVRNPDESPGYTWNPITGCLNGCEYCYARKLANTRVKERYLANKGIAPLIGKTNHIHDEECGTVALDPISDPFYPRLWPERLSQPEKIKKPVGIFTCDMSDWCGIGIPDSWSEWVIEIATRCPQHRFYLLTKQPQNLAKFSPYPDNCWVGVTACNDDMFCDALFWLRKIEARVKYISIEPYLERIEVRATWGDIYLKDAGINWVIIGAQTKPTVYPAKIWVDEIINACKGAGIPYFLKDNLRPLLGNILVQDMPKGVEIDH